MQVGIDSRFVIFVVTAPALCSAVLGNRRSVRPGIIVGMYEYMKISINATF